MPNRARTTKIATVAVFLFATFFLLVPYGTGPLLAVGGSSATTTSETPKEKEVDRTVRLTNPLGTENVPELIGNIIKVVLGIVGAVALLMFIYGGLLWLTAYGSPDKVKRGRDVMIWAAIGLVVIFSSSALVRFVLGAFSEGL